jgi:beta-glucanase (GH16 family)
MKFFLAILLMAAISAFAAPSLVIAPAHAIAGVSTATDACGVKPLKADGTSWDCTFQDDFAGSSLDRSHWVPQTVFTTGTPTAHACYIDSPSTIAVGNGSLNLTVRKVSKAVMCQTGKYATSSRYVAGMVSTYHLFSQQYGRFQARIRATATKEPGLHEAFWMWPDDRVASATEWPAAGEIDTSETYSQYWNRSIPFLHYSADAGGPQLGLNTSWSCFAYRGQWNTYTVEWSPSRIEIFVNGKSCLVNTSGDQAFTKPYIIALTAGLGSGGNAYSSRTPLPATMNIDYVRAWR